MNQLLTFPRMDESTLTALKKAIDESFRTFTRNHGEVLENFFAPLRWFLNQSERFFLETPWPIMLGLIAIVAWFGSRSLKTTLIALAIMSLIGYLGMWEDTMRTISMILVCTSLAIAIGAPIGILMACSRYVRNVVNPILDVMQTLPSFVYLIPVVMLLGIGKVPGLIAVVIYALPPMIRLTDLGIRLVDRDVLEAADAFGSSGVQKLFKVQLPLALPTIMTGINQTIMMALAMVVIASMIGVQGLGQPVLKAIANQYFTLGLFNGMAIVGVAVIFDRVSQGFGRRLQKHSGASHV